MWQRMRRVAVAAAMAGTLATGGGRALGAITYTVRGAVSGWNTVDTWEFNATDGHTVSFSVSTWTTGYYATHIKIQQKTAGGNWYTLDDRWIGDEDTWSSSETVNNWVPSSTERMRFRISRDLGTDAVNWEISCTVN